MTPTIPNCRCGQLMAVSSGQPDLFYCTNCDDVQDSERKAGGKRTPTRADRYFELAWARLKREIYGAS